MRDVIDAIAEANYAATDEQVEALAGVVASGTRADGTYLRVLVTHVQAQVGSPRRKRAHDAPSHLQALESVHSRLYAAVLRGLSSAEPEAAQGEVKRRATFARSACSTLRSYVRTGGDVRTLDPKEVSKGKLRRAAGPQSGSASDRQEAAFRQATAALQRAGARLARTAPGICRRMLEDTLDTLERMLDAVPVVNQTAVDEHGTTSVILPAHVSHELTPGAQLHQPAA